MHSDHLLALMAVCAACSGFATTLLTLCFCCAIAGSVATPSAHAAAHAVNAKVFLMSTLLQLYVE